MARRQHRHPGTDWREAHQAWATEFGLGMAFVEVTRVAEDPTVNSVPMIVLPGRKTILSIC